MKKSNRKQFVTYFRKSKFTGKGRVSKIRLSFAANVSPHNIANKRRWLRSCTKTRAFQAVRWSAHSSRKMMQDSKKQRIDAIIVYRLDRIRRNIGDFAKLIEDLNEREIDFISIREQFDTSTPMGRAMMYIASVFSQLERETIAERIRDNMSELAKTGRWLGGTTPTGYESESISKVTVDGKVRKACKLKIIPEEIGLVKMIFEKFVEFGSLTKVDQYLLESRVPTKRGKSFTRFAIKGILTNPVYMISDEAAYEYLTENEVDLFSEKEAFDGVHGIMAYNRTLQRQGKAQQPKPMNEWIVSVGAHEGVIDGKTWVHVQNMLSLNKSKSYRKPRSNVALVSGLLRCKACGDYMRSKLSNRVNAKGEYIYSYLCATKERSRSLLCQMKNVSGNLLDAMVIEEIKKLSEGWDGSDYAKHLAEAKNAIVSQQNEYDAEIASVREKIAANEKEIKNLVATLAKISGSVSESYVLEQIGELHKDGEALRRRLAELEALNTQNELTELEFNLIRQTLASFSGTVDEMSVQQKRNAIRSLVKRIVWDGADVLLYLLGSAEDDEIPDLSAGAFDEFLEPLWEDSEVKADGFICGRVTMEGSFTGGWYLDLSQYKPVHHDMDMKMDFIVDDLSGVYAIAFDTHGKLGWRSNKIIDPDGDPGYDCAQIIEVLSEDVDELYLGYLESMEIQYIFAGENSIDVELALFKLKNIIGCNTLLLEGGSIINDAFERAGAVDELNLVVAPTVADKDSKPLFMDADIVYFELVKAENENGNLVLDCKRKR